MPSSIRRIRSLRSLLFAPLLTSPRLFRALGSSFTKSLIPLSFSPPSINVRINVQPFAEKTIPGLTAQVQSVPPNREVILIPPKIDIVVRGDIEQLSELTLSDFEATIDFDAILADTSGYVSAKIDLPPGLQMVSRRPERHQYIVRKRL